METNNTLIGSVSSRVPLFVVRRKADEQRRLIRAACSKRWQVVQQSDIMIADLTFDNFALRFAPLPKAAD